MEKNQIIRLLWKILNYDPVHKKYLKTSILSIHNYDLIPVKHCKLRIKSFGQEIRGSARLVHTCTQCEKFKLSSRVKFGWEKNALLKMIDSSLVTADVVYTISFMFATIF